MKPLPPARLAAEDRMIWTVIERLFWCQPGVGYLVPLQALSHDADRRDANHMCKAQHWRHVDQVTWPLVFTGTPTAFDHCGFAALHTGGCVGVRI